MVVVACEEDSLPTLRPCFCRCAVVATAGRGKPPPLHFFCQKQHYRCGPHELEVDFRVRQGLWHTALQRMSYELAVRTVRSLVLSKGSAAGHRVHLRAPRRDIGVRTVLKEQSRDELDYAQAWHSMRPGTASVDVGSDLGLISILAGKYFPESVIISIEAAAPTCLMQTMNLHCNLPAATMADKVRVVNFGLAAQDNTRMTTTYRPDSTTSTRNWTPLAERGKGLGC